MDLELLQYAIDSGMIDLSYAREKYKLNQREEILRKHPHKIWHGSDGYWRTYVTNSCGKRKLVKKKKKEDIEEVIISFAKGEDNFKFKDRYNIWVMRQQKCGRSDNTIYKYQSDYKRFFAGSKLEKMDIRQINDEDILEFITNLLEKKEVPWRALNGMMGYINGVFEKAIIDKVIDKNPCRYVDLPIYRKRCAEEKEKIAEERTLSGDEKQVLLKKIRKKGSMAKYAVEFSIYTGMRVGEIAALRWEDVDFSKEIIHVRHSEKRSRLTGEYTIESTKTGKQRVIPMTREIKEVLFRTRDRQVIEGFSGEYVFMGKNGRIHANAISDCARNNTLSNEFNNAKSIQAIRRTLNSNLRCMGVSPVVASSLLGHTQEVNERNYTYDISNMDMKRNIMTEASKLVITR